MRPVSEKLCDWQSIWIKVYHHGAIKSNRDVFGPKKSNQLKLNFFDWKKTVSESNYEGLTKCALFGALDRTNLLSQKGSFWVKSIEYSTLKKIYDLN